MYTSYTLGHPNNGGGGGIHQCCHGTNLNQDGTGPSRWQLLLHGHLGRAAENNVELHVNALNLVR